MNVVIGYHWWANWKNYKDIGTRKMWNWVWKLKQNIVLWSHESNELPYDWISSVHINLTNRTVNCHFLKLRLTDNGLFVQRKFIFLTKNAKRIWQTESIKVWWCKYIKILTVSLHNLIFLYIIYHLNEFSRIQWEVMFETKVNPLIGHYSFQNLILKRF